MRIEARNLTFAVRGRPLVRDVTLAAGPGETLALIGPNGSGKSTLIRMLAGLLRPNQGQVLLDGVPLSGLGRRQIARRVALVEQRADTAERMTARSVVALGRTPWLSALRPWGDEDELVVLDALKTVEMDSMANRDWATLSGGERQRLQIARALAQQPGVLLLDEPTNHLDIHHQLSILGCIREFAMTTVVALHDLNHAMGCDRVAVLSEGRVVALGTPEDTLLPEILDPVFGVAARWLTEDGTQRRVLSFDLR